MRILFSVKYFFIPTHAHSLEGQHCDDSEQQPNHRQDGASDTHCLEGNVGGTGSSQTSIDILTEMKEDVIIVNPVFRPLHAHDKPRPCYHNNCVLYIHVLQSLVLKTPSAIHESHINPQNPLIATGNTNGLSLTTRIAKLVR